MFIGVMTNIVFGVLAARLSSRRTAVARSWVTTSDPEAKPPAQNKSLWSEVRVAGTAEGGWARVDQGVLWVCRRTSDSAHWWPSRTGRILRIVATQRL